jgi:hypothetical protein
VGDPFQEGEAEEAAGAFDGVYGAEDGAEERRVLRLLFELDNFQFKPREVFVAFDKKFAHYILVLHTPVFRIAMPVVLIVRPLHP